MKEGVLREIIFQQALLIKVNNGTTRTKCEICTKLTIKTLERRQYHRSGVFIVNFEQISHIFLLFPLLTLSKSIAVGMYVRV